MNCFESWHYINPIMFPLSTQVRKTMLSPVARLSQRMCNIEGTIDIIKTLNYVYGENCHSLETSGF